MIKGKVVWAEFIQPHHLDTTFRVRFRTCDGKRYVTPEYDNSKYVEILDTLGLFNHDIEWSVPRWFDGNKEKVG